MPGNRDIDVSPEMKMTSKDKEMIRQAIRRKFKQLGLEKSFSAIPSDQLDSVIEKYFYSNKIKSIKTQKKSELEKKLKHSIKETSESSEGWAGGWDTLLWFPFDCTGLFKHKEKSKVGKTSDSESEISSQTMIKLCTEKLVKHNGNIKVLDKHELAFLCKFLSEKRSPTGFSLGKLRNEIEKAYKSKRVKKTKHQKPSYMAGLKKRLSKHSLHKSHKKKHSKANKKESVEFVHFGGLDFSSATEFQSSVVQQKIQKLPSRRKDVCVHPVKLDMNIVYKVLTPVKHSKMLIEQNTTDKNFSENSIASVKEYKEGGTENRGDSIKEPGLLNPLAVYHYEQDCKTDCQLKPTTLNWLSRPSTSNGVPRGIRSPSLTQSVSDSSLLETRRPLVTLKVLIPRSSSPQLIFQDVHMFDEIQYASIGVNCPSDDEINCPIGCSKMQKQEITKVKKVPNKKRKLLRKFIIPSRNTKFFKKIRNSMKNAKTKDSSTQTEGWFEDLLKNPKYLSDWEPSLMLQKFNGSLAQFMAPFEQLMPVILSLRSDEVRLNDYIELEGGVEELDGENKEEFWNFSQTMKLTMEHNGSGESNWAPFSEVPIKVTEERMIEAVPESETVQPGKLIKKKSLFSETYNTHPHNTINPSSTLKLGKHSKTRRKAKPKESSDSDQLTKRADNILMSLKKKGGSAQLRSAIKRFECQGSTTDSTSDSNSTEEIFKCKKPSSSFQTQTTHPKNKSSLFKSVSESNLNKKKPVVWRGKRSQVVKSRSECWTTSCLSESNESLGEKKSTLFTILKNKMTRQSNHSVKKGRLKKSKRMTKERNCPIM